MSRILSPTHTPTTSYRSTPPTRVPPSRPTVPPTFATYGSTPQHVVDTTTKWNSPHDFSSGAPTTSSGSRVRALAIAADALAQAHSSATLELKPIPVASNNNTPSISTTTSSSLQWVTATDLDALIPASPPNANVGLNSPWQRSPSSVQPTQPTAQIMLPSSHSPSMSNFLHTVSSTHSSPSSQPIPSPAPSPTTTATPSPASSTPSTPTPNTVPSTNKTWIGTPNSTSISTSSSPSPAPSPLSSPIVSSTPTPTTTASSPAANSVLAAIKQFQSASSSGSITPTLTSRMSTARDASSSSSASASASAVASTTPTLTSTSNNSVRSPSPFSFRSASPSTSATAIATATATAASASPALKFRSLQSPSNAAAPSSAATSTSTSTSTSTPKAVPPPSPLVRTSSNSSTSSLIASGAIAPPSSSPPPPPPPPVPPSPAPSQSPSPLPRSSLTSTNITSRSQASPSPHPMQDQISPRRSPIDPKLTSQSRISVPTSSQQSQSQSQAQSQSQSQSQSRTPARPNAPSSTSRVPPPVSISKSRSSAVAPSSPESTSSSHSSSSHRPPPFSLNSNSTIDPPLSPYKPLSRRVNYVPAVPPPPPPGAVRSSTVSSMASSYRSDTTELEFHSFINDTPLLSPTAMKTNPPSPLVDAVARHLAQIERAHTQSHVSTHAQAVATHKSQTPVQVPVPLPSQSQSISISEPSQSRAPDSPTYHTSDDTLLTLFFPELSLVSRSPSPSIPSLPAWAGDIDDPDTVHVSHRLHVPVHQPTYNELSPTSSPTLVGISSCSPPIPMRHLMLEAEAEEKKLNPEMARKFTQELPVDLTCSDENSFDYMSILGSGSFGKVVRVRHKPTGKQYAMKIIDKQQRAKLRKLKGEDAHSHEEDEEHLVLSRLGYHPFIIRLEHSFYTRHRIHLVMELVRGGTLDDVTKERCFDHSDKKKRKPMAEETVRILAAQMVLALEHIHAHGYVYRDLKPDNLLLDEWGNIRIADLGVACQISSTRPHLYRCIGAVGWKAPEMLNARQSPPASTPTSPPTSAPVSASSSPRGSIIRRMKSLTKKYRKGSVSESNSSNTSTTHSPSASPPSTRASLSREKQQIHAFHALAAIEESGLFSGRTSSTTNTNTTTTTTSTSTSIPNQSNEKITTSIPNQPSDKSTTPLPAEGSYDYSVDWWNLGILVRLFLSGRHPFHQTLFKSIDQCIRSHRSPDLSPIAGVSDHAHSFIASLLEYDVSKRLGCNGIDRRLGGAQVRKHPWFRDIDWKAVLSKQLLPVREGDIRILPLPPDEKPEFRNLDDVMSSFDAMDKDLIMDNAF